MSIFNQETTQNIVKQFNDVMKQYHKKNDKHLLERANELAEKIIYVTRETYQKIYNNYRDVRGNKIKEIDNICWTILEKYIERYISNDKSSVNILDVGTGNGRDIIYGQSLGYNVIGVDNCSGFIEILSEHERNGLINANSYKECDMRSLDFSDNLFDVIRFNASLLHLPLIEKGYTVDLALSEAYRVLKNSGLLYVFVKTGSILELHDTKENLGGRIFQLFSHDTLNEVIMRNGFTIVYTSDEIEIRENSKINWILLIAQKI